MAHKLVGLGSGRLLQRPDSMPRAFKKARVQLKLGAYLVSVKLEAVGLTPVEKLEGAQGKAVWVYRLPQMEV